MATHSSILAQRIPWTEEPGALQSMGLQRVGHDLATEQQLQQHTPSLGIPYIPEEQCGAQRKSSTNIF